MRLLRGVYPEREEEILRYAQNDKRRARNDMLIVIARGVSDEAISS
ncbi:MAG TPA: hypothetical protein ACFYD6_08990 [Candidatus Brocadiia bacterium]|nr:hypothetical protein [Planctomycetota bacterium]MBI4006913.1 hypothetical protein [Planctomycetota bacterium]MDO8093600.1 hypothetical protein [Candidatus Brocadiales bacterium]